MKSALQDETVIKPCIINGLNKESIRQLKNYAQNGVCEDGCNMVEVMCREEGCIGGNAAMNNQKSAKKQIGILANKSEDIKKIT